MTLPFTPRPAPQRPRADRARGVTAVLGPTNTGKTHLAIERLVTHSSGIIGLPLRLLAREVYNRVVEKVGAERVALITGEEKIKPAHPAFWISTVEAMPRDLVVAFVAVDEIQLAADLDRGHIFTDRLLNRRGREETLLLGAATMRPAIEALIPGVNIVERPRLSKLSFAGEKKLSRLPPRSAIVAFSAEDVYAIAELIRRQRGGAAVVLGALSPRTRNAQVALYQNSEVDYIVATDAIGMGLNLDVDHVAFASDRKFDGWHHRRLNPAEFGQIAGRAGRHIRDGTFGTTGRCPPFDEELVELLQEHRFDPVTMLQWRNSQLDFSTIESLQISLDRLPGEPGLTRAPLAEDVLILDIAAHDADVRKSARIPADIERLWSACQIPDYRKLSPSAHAELVMTIYNFIVRAGRISDDWFSRQLALHDRVDGDIDTLSARIAQVRTCTYIANRPDWLMDPEHWQGVARQVEDRLSDALHERLAQRFIDRRTSLLMRRMREKTMLEAEINAVGDVTVEGEHVGQLLGFRFTPDPNAEGREAKALNAAALRGLAREFEARAAKLHEAVDASLVLANDGLIRWLGDPVARLAAGGKMLQPQAHLIADDHLAGAANETVQTRLDLWLARHVKKLLGPLFDLEAGEGLEGIARGIAFQVGEALGVLERAKVGEDLKSLDQNARGLLRKLGLRFGAYHVFLPALLKPAPRGLGVQLWALKHGGLEQNSKLSDVLHLASSGRTSLTNDKEVARGLYLAAGFRVCGERAVRVDILERLADLIRPAIHYRPGLTPGAPPPGAADRDGFVVTPNMISLAGCSAEDFASVLRSLSYVAEKRAGPAITVPLLPEAGLEPVVVSAAPALEAAAVEAARAANEDEPELPFDLPPVAVAPAPVAAVEPVAIIEAAPAAATPAEVPDAEAAPADEPVLIEVWRPQRHNAHANRRPEGQERSRRPQRRDTPALAADGTALPTTEGQTPPADGERRERSRGRNRHRHGAPREGGEAVAATPGEAAATPADGAAATPGRFSRPPRQDRPNGGARPERSGAPGGRPAFRDKRPDDKGRPPRRREDGDRQRGGASHQTWASTEEPKSRDRQPDPNSPFAKLLALKAVLEGKSGE